MKESKRSRNEDHSEGVDWISRLPEPILEIIVAKLPVTTEESVRTSILSKQWRHLSVSVPSVDVDCSRRGESKEFNKKEFKEFVYWVLVNKRKDLDSFRLSCSDHYNMSTIWRWIHGAVMRNVKELYLDFFTKEGDDYEEIRLPHCLLKCDSLKVLKLFLTLSPLDLVDDQKVFPKFKILELKGPKLLDERRVEKFFNNCHSLEELVLVDCLLFAIEYLNISCPNLKSLRIDNRKLAEYEYPEGDDIDHGFGSAFKDHYQPGYKRYYKHGLCETLIFECPALEFFEFGGEVAIQFYPKVLKSLKKAVIYPEDMLLGQLEISTVCELFGLVSLVESLSINYYFIKCLNDDRDYPKSLLNLTTLELRTKINAVTMNVLTKILKRSPILESLHLIFEQDISGEELKAFAEELNVVETGKIVTRHLKRVEFLEFNGEKEKLAIARSLLEHGNALEEMVFSWSCKDKDMYLDKSTTVLNEVSKFHKASSFVKFITRV